MQFNRISAASIWMSEILWRRITAGKNIRHSLRSRGDFVIFDIAIWQCYLDTGSLLDRRNCIVDLKIWILGSIIQNIGSGHFSNPILEVQIIRQGLKYMPKMFWPQKQESFPIWIRNTNFTGSESRSRTLVICNILFPVISLISCVWNKLVEN